MENMANVEEIRTLKMPELRDLSKRYGMKGVSKMTKPQLTEALVNHLESIVAEPVEPVDPEKVIEEMGVTTDDIAKMVKELENDLTAVTVEDYSGDDEPTPPPSPVRKKPRKAPACPRRKKTPAAELEIIQDNTCSGCA